MVRERGRLAVDGATDWRERVGEADAGEEGRPGPGRDEEERGEYSSRNGGERIAGEKDALLALCSHPELDRVELRWVEVMRTSERRERPTDGSTLAPRLELKVQRDQDFAHYLATCFDLPHPQPEPCAEPASPRPPGTSSRSLSLLSLHGLAALVRQRTHSSGYLNTPTPASRSSEVIVRFALLLPHHHQLALRLASPLLVASHVFRSRQRRQGHRAQGRQAPLHRLRRPVERRVAPRGHCLCVPPPSLPLSLRQC